MRPIYFSTLLLIILSFFSALLLNIIPLPPILALFYPLWLPLVLIYWIVVLPEHIHPTLVWVLGLLIDVLQGSYLGEHSLALCIIAFLVYRFHLQFRMFPLAQQVLFVFIALTIYQGILVLLQMLLGFSIDFRWIWIPLLTSAFMWPLMRNILGANLLDIRY